MSVIAELATLRHHVVVLEAEGSQADRLGPRNINGALALSVAVSPPVFRSISTLNNSVRTGGDSFYNTNTHIFIVAPMINSKYSLY